MLRRRTWTELSEDKYVRRMIGQNEIKAKAIEFDILHPNVERDYVFGWLLKSFYENDYGLFTRERYACLNQQRRGICDNGRTITREKIEQRVLAGLKGSSRQMPWAR